MESSSSEEQLYFLFDTDILKSLNREQRTAYDGLRWEKLISTTFERGNNEVVLGRLKR